MTKREVVRLALDHRPPPYVPWQLGFTAEARGKLQGHFPGRPEADRLGQGRTADLDARLGNHFLKLGYEIGIVTDLGDGRVRDHFGVVWDRSIDRDIGNVEGTALPRPTLKGYSFPDPLDPRGLAEIPKRIAERPDHFRVFEIGFSLWERAWTLRGMVNLMMDFHDHPRFVHELLGAIADWNTTQIRAALKHDIDMVYFGDDWGQQRGLQMGPGLWREFILPELKRMFRVVREAGRYVMVHSCGDVDELFDDLVEAGLNCFNPFQPEVMEVDALKEQYRGRLAFCGGLSTQRTLPYGSPEEVRKATLHLLDLGREGGYIFAPAHDVEGDVSLDNMLAFIEVVQSQPGLPPPA
jgi:uroporphyrinogen decarboxylase